MRLSDLMQGMDKVEAGDVDVTGFAIDNRKVAPGNVFGAFVAPQSMARISSSRP
jgi:UDP-N-acetylmuramoyl-L-alanyl-D-glutamate--2,6-diaminopimelate ligase